MSEILIVSDVATRLKLAERTVNEMLADRELPGFKVRGQWRLRSDHFERWLNLVGAGRSAQEATALISAESETAAVAIRADSGSERAKPSSASGAATAASITKDPVEPEKERPKMQLLSERGRGADQRHQRRGRALIGANEDVDRRQLCTPDK